MRRRQQTGSVGDSAAHMSAMGLLQRARVHITFHFRLARPFSAFRFSLSALALAHCTRTFTRVTVTVTAVARDARSLPFSARLQAVAFGER